MISLALKTTCINLETFPLVLLVYCTLQHSILAQCECVIQGETFILACGRQEDSVLRALVVVSVESPMKEKCLQRYVRFLVEGNFRPGACLQLIVSARE